MKLNGVAIRYVIDMKILSNNYPCLLNRNRKASSKKADSKNLNLFL